MAVDTFVAFNPNADLLNFDQTAICAAHGHY